MKNAASKNFWLLIGIYGLVEAYWFAAFFLGTGLGPCREGGILENTPSVSVVGNFLTAQSCSVGNILSRVLPTWTLLPIYILGAFLLFLLLRQASRKIKSYGA